MRASFFFSRFFSSFCNQQNDDFPLFCTNSESRRKEKSFSCLQPVGRETGKPIFICCALDENPQVLSYCVAFYTKRRIFYWEFRSLLLLLVYIITRTHGGLLVAGIFSGRFHNSSMTWKTLALEFWGTFRFYWLLFGRCFLRRITQRSRGNFFRVFFSFSDFVRTALQKWTKFNQLSSFLPRGEPSASDTDWKLHGKLIYIASEAEISCS